MIDVTVTRRPLVPRKIRKPMGRPKFLDLGASFEIWFQVEDQKRRTNLSCEPGRPRWIEADEDDCQRHPAPDLSGDLPPSQSRAAEYDLFRSLLTPASREQSYADELCPTLRWFHDERERRLAF